MFIIEWLSIDVSMYKRYTVPNSTIGMNVFGSRSGCQMIIYCITIDLTKICLLYGIIQVQT